MCCIELLAEPCRYWPLRIIVDALDIGWGV
jgi:hypothetical protein